VNGKPTNLIFSCVSLLLVKTKLTSIGLRADPGLLTVSPQVT